MSSKKLRSVTYAWGFNHSQKQPELLRAWNLFTQTGKIETTIICPHVAESSRPTTHEDPITIEEGVVHYCVSNILAIAERGWERALSEDPALKRGLNVCDGRVFCKPVAEAFGMPFEARS
jgi:alanine dehydrogenase